MTTLHTHAHVRLNSRFVSSSSFMLDKTGFSKLFYNLINFIDYDFFNKVFKETYDEILDTKYKVKTEYSFSPDFFDKNYEKLFVITLLKKILENDDPFTFKNDIELQDFVFDDNGVIETKGESFKNTLKESLQKAIESLEYSKPVSINLDLEDVIEIRPYCKSVD